MEYGLSLKEHNVDADGAVEQYRSVWERYSEAMWSMTESLAEIASAPDFSKSRITVGDFFLGISLFITVVRLPVWVPHTVASPGD